MNKVDILIACDLNKSRPWFRDRIPAIKKAIEKSNYNIELIDIYDSLGNFENMPTHLNQRKLFLQNENLLVANKNFEDKVIEAMPKILVLGTADNYIEFLLPMTIKNIRQKGIFVSGILGDDEFNFNSYKFLLGWFNLFIAYVKPCVKFYEEFKISNGYFFPNSCYLHEKEFNEISQETEFDIVLMGSPFANRPLILKSLIHSGFKVGVYGSKKWIKYKYIKNNYNGFVETEKFDEALAKGKIVLALLEDHISGNLHMNTKIWEAVRVGRLPICSYYKPLFEDYGLIEGVNIVTYKSIQELLTKVKYYITNESERLKVIRNLYEKVKAEFDYSILYLKLFDDLISFQKNNKENLVVDNLDHKPIIFSSDKMDSQVKNILNIVNQNKNNQLKYIYFDSIEEGKRVISRWPFVSFNNIVFLNNDRSRIKNRLIFLTSFNKKKFLHINQFCVIKNRLTVIGRINRAIDKIAYFIRKMI